MESHIKATINRYKATVKSWDVVNEALSDDANPATLYRDSQFYQISGASYIKKAFQWAAEADPTAELWYNDYNLEEPTKLAKLLTMIDDLQGQGIPLTGIGLQGHYSLGWPGETLIRNTVDAIVAKGLKVKISELDVTVYDDYSSGSFSPEAQKPCDSTVQKALANRYDEIFTIFRSYQTHTKSISFWGLKDDESWLNDFPVTGRANCPLLFDASRNPKAAFERVIEIP